MNFPCLIGIYKLSFLSTDVTKSAGQETCFDTIWFYIIEILFYFFLMCVVMHDDEPVLSLLRRAQHEPKIKFNHDKFNSNYSEVILT